MFRLFFSYLFRLAIFTSLIFSVTPFRQLKAFSGINQIDGTINSNNMSKPVFIEKGLGVLEGNNHPVYLPVVLNNYDPNLLPVRGPYVSFERRGSGSGYFSGEAISNFTDFDPVVRHTVAEEISLQLDRMKQMGVNTITYELRAADPDNTGSFVFPSCNINTVLGLHYPQPTATEKTNLGAFLDLLQSKGIRLFCGWSTRTWRNSLPRIMSSGSARF